jgi:hypothetical protein
MAIQPWFFELMMKIFGKVFAFICVFLLCGVAIAVISQYGILHPASAFGIGSAIVMVLILWDSYSTDKISKSQWAALAINITLLAYTYLLLPTKEALKSLDESGVKQNLLELLIGKIT